MREFYFSWLIAAIALPLAGALCIRRIRDFNAAWWLCVLFSGASAACSLAAWVNFAWLGGNTVTDPAWLPSTISRELLLLDRLNAPLLALGALTCFLVMLSTPRGKAERFPFAVSLLSQSLILATVGCQFTWGIVALLALGVLPPLWELRQRNKPTRVFVVHMAAFVLLLVSGAWLVSNPSATALSLRSQVPSVWMLLPLMLALFIRCGVAPFHCWITDLFEHGSFGGSMITVIPLVGAHATMKLLIPVATPGQLSSMGWFVLATAFYAAGMSLVQKEMRRFFCYLFISHAALVLFGLLTMHELGVTGALCVWLSSGLSLTGLGLILRALEARHGRIALTGYHGVYEHTPLLAIGFLVMGLASVGFPCTFGFVGAEILVDAAIHLNPLAGVTVVVAAMLNGIAVVQVYFRLFTGSRFKSTVPLRVSAREQLAVLTVCSLIFVGGLFPQFPVEACSNAARVLLTLNRASGDDQHQLLDATSKVNVPQPLPGGTPR